MPGILYSMLMGVQGAATFVSEDELLFDFWLYDYWYSGYLIGAIIYFVLTRLNFDKAKWLAKMNPLVVSLTVPFFLPTFATLYDDMILHMNLLAECPGSPQIISCVFLRSTIFFGFYQVGSAFLFAANFMSAVLMNKEIRRAYYYSLLAIFHFFFLFLRLALVADA